MSLTVAGKDRKVRYRERIRLNGAVEPKAAGRVVALEHAAHGERFRPVAATATAANGSFRFAVRPRRSGSFRAVAQAGSAASAPQRVTVRARVLATSRRHVLGSRRVRVRGGLLPRLRGRAVRLQLRTRRGWRTVDRARTRRGGRFEGSFSPRTAGIYRLRVRFAGDRSAGGASDRLPPIFVYRAGHASWYGPGLWGNATTCGGRLSAGRLGVANRWLPCGTRVTFRYRGRTVTVPVIDRGPFAGGREWDLTAAAKRRLRFGDVGVVWSTR